MHEAAAVDPATTAQQERFFALLAGQKDVFEQIARGVELPHVLDALVRLIETHSRPGAKASVLLLTDDGRRLRHGAAPSLPEHYNEAIDGIEIGPSVGSCGTAAFRREPVIVADIATDALWHDFRDLAASAGVAACWSVPIVGADGHVLGTFAVYHPSPGEPDDDDLAVLASFVQTAAVAIERHRDLDALVREKRRAEALHQVGQAIARRLDLGEIVQQATDAATALAGAAFGAFFYNVISADGESYTLYTLSGAPREAFEKFPMPRNTAIFAPTFNGEGVVRSDDILADPRYGQNEPYHGMPPGHLPVRSYLAVPVVTSDGEVAGGLFFGHPEPGRFDEEAETLVVGIAAQAAVGIENARLYEAAQREAAARSRAFEERDRVARMLQESLLPSALPKIPGLDLAARYRACIEGVGGDFYDVFPVGDDLWGVVIGDVCGKGAEAAALTSLARHTVRTAAMMDPRPTEVLRVLNDALREHDDRTPGRFCTAVVGLLDVSGATPRLTLARAGHPHPLLARNGSVLRVGGDGRLLGVAPDIEATNDVVELAPGDAVVLYTDGLTDVGRDSDVLGPEWVGRTLAAHRADGARAVADRLADGGVEFQRLPAGRDDIAVLVLAVPA
jgi:GAF domain-containing protein